MNANSFDFEVLDGVHRKNFIQNRRRPRRMFSPNGVEDTIYSELKEKDRIPYLIKRMDKVFQHKLDSLLF